MMLEAGGVGHEEKKQKKKRGEADARL